VERLSEVRSAPSSPWSSQFQLQEVVESGIVVDCEATPEMLETIFFPNNAIHDGGVIIAATHRLRRLHFPADAAAGSEQILGRASAPSVERGDGCGGGGGVRGERTDFVCVQGAVCARSEQEVLRAFLTSVLVKPQRQQSMIDWFKPGTPRRHAPPAPEPRVQKATR